MNFTQHRLCRTPEETFGFGVELGRALVGGEVILLRGGLGAGKTLFTKGVLESLGYDADEVTSPSFTLVNLYRTDECDVYHIDFWRLDEGVDAGFAVGLGEILADEKCIVLIEWPERLKTLPKGRKLIDIEISGDGDDPRTVSLKLR
jgi:tRNA threonylcarbamoyladenosine biosynthesis protein TsaE